MFSNIVEDWVMGENLLEKYTLEKVEKISFLQLLMVLNDSRIKHTYGDISYLMNVIDTLTRRCKIIADMTGADAQYQKSLLRNEACKQIFETAYIRAIFTVAA